MMKILMMTGVVGLALGSMAMPTKNELKDVQGVVNEVMSSDMQAMKAGRIDASKVAANAEKYAGEADTEAAKFLLLKGSFGLYMQGGSYDDALRVLNKLTSEIKGVPDKVIAEIVVAKLKKASKREGAAVFEYYERIERRMRLTGERGNLEKALKANPASKEVNRDLAVCLAGLGDWAAALPHFAAGGGKEAQAAKAEQTDKATAADLWWEAAQGDAADLCREHAATLYRAALDGNKLSGLKCALARKRIAEVFPEGASVADASERIVDTPIAQKTSTAEPTNVGKTTVPTGSCDWSIPANLTGVRTLDFDLGCPEKMTFFAVPPGSCKITLDKLKKDVPIKITRPFWISQFPVTLDQYRALGFDCNVTGMDKLEEACKGDPSVTILMPVLPIDQPAFFRELNQRFGKTLPKGMVFRPLTLGESVLACDVVSRERGGIRVVVNDKHKMDAWQRKGYYKDCKTVEEFMKQRWRYNELGIPPADTLCYYKSALRSARQPVVTGGTAPTLDRWSCKTFDSLAGTTWSKVHYRDRVAHMEKMLFGNGDPVVDPFWFCVEHPMMTIIGTLGGMNRLGRFDILDNPRYRTEPIQNYFIRVAVGYDYEGEWCRKNGK